MNRLFVPLKTKFFAAFQNGKKEWELRGINDQFNRDTVREGRQVELRNGYSGESIWGTVGQVKMFDQLQDVPGEIDYKKISPRATSRKEFVRQASSLLSKYDQFIAFRVFLD